jgi:threonine aldolase
MGNLTALLSHCNRGDEVILGNKSHTYLYEAGGVSALGSIHSCQLPNQPDGTLLLEDIQGAIRSDDIHQPITRLICLENTHNRCGGVHLDVEYMQAVGKLAQRHGLKLHLDGARIFNAAIAQGVSVQELIEPADSVTFCLSKALCAPVGSVLCGSGSFISQARRIRKQLGGGMRQAGILAAAGIIALENMVTRLSEDHARARALAEGLKNVPGLLLDPGTPYTNMVFLNLAEQIPLTAKQISQRLADRGVLAGVTGTRRFRLVTHYWIDDEAVGRAIAAFRLVLTAA